jgi:hypothetical protein
VRPFRSFPIIQSQEEEPCNADLGLIDVTNSDADAVSFRLVIQTARRAGKSVGRAEGRLTRAISTTFTLEPDE